MMGENDIVTFYQMCDEAQEHFQQHFGHVRTYKLRFQSSPQALEHIKTLRDVEMYLRKSLMHAANNYRQHAQNLASLENFLDGEAIEQVSAAFEEGVILIGSVLTAISCTKEYLFTDMKPTDFTRLVENAPTQTIRGHLSRCEGYLGEARRGCEQAEKDHERENEKGHADILEELIATAYKTSRDLNKFEDKTDQDVRRRAIEQLEEAWEGHTRRLRNLEKVITHLKEDVKSWEEKHKILQATIDTRVEKSDINDNEKTATTDTIAEVECTQHVSAKYHQETEKISDTAIENTESGKDVIPTNNSATITSIQPTGDPADTTSPTTPIQSSTPSARLIKISLPTIQPDHNNTVETPTPSNSNTLVHTTNPTTSTPEKAETPPKEDSFVFITRRQYEYDHNKENTPVVSMPETNKDKESWNKAFAGLDLYARSLYSKSPGPSPMLR